MVMIYRREDTVKLVDYLIIYIVFCIVAKLLQSVIPCVIPVAMVLCLVVLTTKLLLDVSKDKNQSWALLYFVAGIFFKIVFIFVDETVNIASPLNADSYGYKEAAEAVITGKSSIYSQFLPTFMAKTVYLFWGVSPLFLRFLIGFISILTVAVFLHICKDLDIDRKTTKIVLMFFLLAPMPNIYACSILREGFILFFSLCGVMYLNSWMLNGKKKELFAAACCLMMSTLCHSGMIALLLVALMSYVFYSNGKFRCTPAMVKKVAVVMLATMVCLFFLADLLFAKFGGGIGYDNLLSRVAYLESEGGNSLYRIYLNTGVDCLDLLVLTAIRTVYFFFSPMVWDIKNTSTFVMFLLDSVLYLGLTIVILKRQNRIPNERKPIFLTLIGMILLDGVVFGWGTVTAGTAMRHRAVFLPFMLLLYAIEKTEIVKERYGNSNK